MKTIVAIVCVLSIASAFDYAQLLLQEDENTLQKWQDFVSKYEKYYGSEEEIYNRFSIFKKNLKVAKSYQWLNPTADYGVTQFSDLTAQEFRDTYLTLKSEDIKKHNVDLLDLDVNVEDAPASWDWREHGAVTPVKNQGQCGSCWAFSTVANLEGQYFLQSSDNTLTSFSEQELVDCDHNGDMGCRGGLMQNAFKWLETNGFELESEYPYRGVKGTCSEKSHKEVEMVKSFKIVDKDETTIAATLAQVGPLSAAVNAGPFQHYTGGVMDPWSLLCNPSKLDHGITLVGYGNAEGKDYWLIKNSWGPTWGEKGYIRLKRGSGTCGVNTNVVTAQL